jgi:hypothetical protein
MKDAVDLALEGLSPHLGSIGITLDRLRRELNEQAVVCGTVQSNWTSLRAANASMSAAKIAAQRPLWLLQGLRAGMSGKSRSAACAPSQFLK